MRSLDEVNSAQTLMSRGLSDAEIERQTAIPRTTIRDWRRGGGTQRPRACANCSNPPTRLDERAYVYLLGLYLGDGYIARTGREGVVHLRISLDLRYPGIIQGCAAAMAAVMPYNTVRVSERRTEEHPDGGLAIVSSYSKHWGCLIPQGGRGTKHSRPIALEPWQRVLMWRYPATFLRGLIHSDGWRGSNRVSAGGRVYTYPRYLFSNMSRDILSLFSEACDILGVMWRYNKENSISIARRASVEILDRYIGPKA